MASIQKAMDVCFPEVSCGFRALYGTIDLCHRGKRVFFGRGVGVALVMHAHRSYGAAVAASCEADGLHRVSRGRPDEHPRFFFSSWVRREASLASGICICFVDVEPG